jgi:hypothetical protein
MKDLAQVPFFFFFFLMKRASRYSSDVFETVGAPPLYAKNLFYFLFHIWRKGLLKVFNFWVDVTSTLLMFTETK